MYDETAEEREARIWKEWMAWAGRNSSLREAAKTLEWMVANGHLEQSAAEPIINALRDLEWKRVAGGM